MATNVCSIKFCSEHSATLTNTILWLLRNLVDQTLTLTANLNCDWLKAYQKIKTSVVSRCDEKNQMVSTLHSFYLLNLFTPLKSKLHRLSIAGSEII